MGKIKSDRDFKLPGIVTGFSYFSQENLHAVVKASSSCAEVADLMSNLLPGKIII